MIHVLDLSFNLDEGLEYYSILEKDYQHLKWEFRKDHNDLAMIDPKNMIDQLEGWGLQTTYSDPNFVYHCDLDPHDESYEYFKDTILVFGFFKRFKEKFNNPFRSFLFKFPPDNYIGETLSGGPGHCKILMVLQSNNQTKIISHGVEKQEIIMETGKIYLIETNYKIEYRNDGDTISILLGTQVLNEEILKILSMKGSI